MEKQSKLETLYPDLSLSFISNELQALLSESQEQDGFAEGQQGLIATRQDLLNLLTK